MEKYIVERSDWTEVEVNASSSMRAMMQVHFEQGEYSEIRSISGTDVPPVKFFSGFNAQTLTNEIENILSRAALQADSMGVRGQKIKALSKFMENTYSIGFPSKPHSEKIFCEVNGVRMIPDEVLYWAYEVVTKEPSYESEMVLALLKFYGGFFNTFVQSRAGCLV